MLWTKVASALEGLKEICIIYVCVKYLLFSGGPHSVFSGDFLLYAAGLCRCGFAVLLGKELG